MEDSIKEDFFFSNPNDTIDSDGLEDNNGVDFAINTIFSNLKQTHIISYLA